MAYNNDTLMGRHMRRSIATVMRQQQNFHVKHCVALYVESLFEGQGRSYSRNLLCFKVFYLACKLEKLLYKSFVRIWKAII